ncbi:MAG: phage major capsid protein [Planctomycetota bacterium]
MPALTLAQAFPNLGKPSLKALTEERQALLDEAASIDKRCRDESREPNADEANRFEAIMKVELPAAERCLAIAQADWDSRADQALRRRAERLGAECQGAAAAGAGMLFRDAATGRTIRALTPGESVADFVAALSGEWHAGGDGDSINDRHDEPLDAGPDLPAVGDALVSMATGAALPDGRSIQAALGGIDTDGGFLLNPALAGMFIDLARSASVAFRAGALTYVMGSPEVNIMRADSDPTGHWRPEGVEVKASSPTFGRINLKAKTLAAIVPVSIELLEDAVNAGSIIEGMIRSALGIALDRAILRGAGAESEPLGITNNAGVNTVTSVGTPADYSKITAAVGKILNANFSGSASELAWVQNPRDSQTFDGLQATDNQPLQPTPWAGALQRYSTTSMPVDLGTGSNESEAIIGDFSQVIVGMRTSGINVRVLDAGEVSDAGGELHNAASHLKRLIVAYMRADVALLRPSWFTVLSGVTAAS